MQVFLHMQNAARTDKGCLPNVITYSALITAFVAGGRLARAHEIFLSMRHSSIAPDHICYSTLIAGGAPPLTPNCQTSAGMRKNAMRQVRRYSVEHSRILEG